MPLASLESCPTELSLPEEPYPLSWASLLPCEFASDRRQRDEARIFVVTFPAASALRLLAHPRESHDS